MSDGRVKDEVGSTAVRYAVGLMSGTSVDGIDAAVVELIDEPGRRMRVKLVEFVNKPFPPQLRADIFTLFDVEQATVDRVARMNMRLGEWFAEAALAVIAQAGLSPTDISVIGSHGQTIYHAPDAVHEDGRELRFTVQIGEGAVIAARTGIPTVTDFRVADMVVGGQGAPMVPFVEYLLYREEKRTLLLQNIGGIGNMTVLPAGCTTEEVIAFDTGPGNVLIDGLVSHFTSGRQTMDVDGVMAARGQVSEELLGLLQQEPYYRLPYPKSTGRELFHSGYIERFIEVQHKHRLSAEDLVATATKLTAWSIGDAYRTLVQNRYEADVMIVGGGGSYNPTLLKMLQEEMGASGVQVMTQEAIGMHSDAKEAIAFAVLADHTIRRVPSSLPSVTGAERPMVLGKVSY